MFYHWNYICCKFNWQLAEYPSLHLSSDKVKFFYRPTDRQEAKSTHGIPSHHGDFLTICCRHWWRHWFSFDPDHTLDDDVCLLRLFGWWTFREMILPAELLDMKAGVPWQQLIAPLSFGHFSQIHSINRKRGWQIIGKYKGILGQVSIQYNKWIIKSNKWKK